LTLVTVDKTAEGPRPGHPIGAWRVRTSSRDGVQRVSLRTLGHQPGLALIALRRTSLGIEQSDLLTPESREPVSPEAAGSRR
jgi:hypothetical protein